MPSTKIAEVMKKGFKLLFERYFFSMLIVEICVQSFSNNLLENILDQRFQRPSYQKHGNTD
jgi:hypothetical protein